MSYESSKTRRVRPADFASRYLSGRVIDIGCGPDPIVPHAEPFDVEDGDAQKISEMRPCLAYDAVCSSHCLEHMRDVPEALQNWWSLVRPGGVLILVVPDEDLYEQGVWPSLFNPDHKATFRLGSPRSWSPVSYDILELVSGLHGAQIVSAQHQTDQYDKSLQMRGLANFGRPMATCKWLLKGVLRRLGLLGDKTSRFIDRAFFKVGAPIDQTSGPALAQIEIIARKQIEQ